MTIPADPPRPALPLPAAAYVRMSTEHQQYSTANQLDRIKDYATRRGMQLIRTFADEGKSGLHVRGRDSLRKLIAEVESGHAAFKAILVYDISRWGRFQDADESGYYEYLCKRAGITVHYCAEQFENDGSPSSNIIKSVKRSMAGEFSRELSIKVFQGACRLARLGFKVGGPAGYGLRRQVVGADGRPKGVLERGEQKFLTTDRIVLVPGPAAEQQVVREIFDSYVHRGLGCDRLAAELNRRQIPSHGGRPWTPVRVATVLRNENYIGNLVWSRTSFKLHHRLVRNPPEQWIRANGVYPALVEPTLFARAQQLRRERAENYSDDDLLDALRDLWRRRGRLSAPCIDADPGMPHSSTYVLRFGGLVPAYHRIGYPFRRNVCFLTVKRQLRTCRGEFFSHLLAVLAARGVPAAHDPARDTVTIAGEFTLAVVFTRARRTRDNTLRWPARTDRAADITLVARLQESSAVILDYYLFPRLDRPPAVTLRPRNHLLIEAYRSLNFDPLLAVTERIRVEDVA